MQFTSRDADIQGEDNIEKDVKAPRKVFNGKVKRHDGQGEKILRIESCVSDSPLRKCYEKLIQNLVWSTDVHVQILFDLTYQ